MLHNGFLSATSDRLGKHRVAMYTMMLTVWIGPSVLRDVLEAVVEVPRPVLQQQTKAREQENEVCYSIRFTLCFETQTIYLAS